MNLKALSIGKQALQYSKPGIKTQVITSFLLETEKVLMNLENFNNVVSNSLAKYDNFIELCGIALENLKNTTNLSLNVFEELLYCPIKHQGIFLNWIRAYKFNKTREEKCKVTQSSYEDKNDRNHPLFYYKIFKNLKNCCSCRAVLCSLKDRSLPPRHQYAILRTPPAAPTRVTSDHVL